MWMASSLELGPGTRLLAPSRSRNFSRESHRRRRTSSSSMMPIWAAGPPNAVVPRRRKNEASSRIEPVSIWAVDSESSSTVRSGIDFVPFRSNPRIESKRSTADDQKKYQTKHHAYIGSGFVQSAPKAVLRKRDDLGRIQRNANVH